MLPKFVFTSGVVAAASIMGYGYKRKQFESDWKDKPLWYTFKAKCKSLQEPPFSDRATWSDKDYCFYCGRGGSQNEDSTVNMSISIDSRPDEKQVGCSELGEAVSRARTLIKSAMVEYGVPGCVVAVVKDGEGIWSEGLGYADVENDVPCSAKSVMRIASISKPLSAVALLQLYQQGMVDLDAPIQKYVPEFPQKSYNGEKVNITVRLLMSHLAGIRHYNNKDDSSKGSIPVYLCFNPPVGEREKGEFTLDEYYIMDHYDSIKESLKLFSEDDLLCKPGSEYHYSTLGWTLLGAVIENVSGMPYLEYMKKYVLNPLDMSSTEAEYHKNIIKGRSKHYFRRSNGSLSNVPYVDLSYKWAGGGYLSNAEDLVVFGNSVLNCCQHASRNKQKSLNVAEDICLLKPATTKLMLSPTVTDIDVNAKEAAINLPPPAPPIGYGLGWYVRPSKKGLSGGKDYPLVFGHTGGAVGACSVLTILPSQPNEDHDSVSTSKPNSVVVAIIFNLQEVGGVFKLGLKVAEEFKDIP